MRRPAWPMLMVAAAGAAIAGAGCNAYPAAPTNPAYDLDVRPVLMAHCARCHGAGGTLNLPTEPTGPGAPPIPSVADPTVQSGFALYNLYVTQFDTSPGCDLTPPSDCKVGAGRSAALIASAVDPTMTKPPLFMPPAPAPQLNDWEIGILANWAKNAVCSNATTVDLAICPHGPGKAM